MRPLRWKTRYLSGNAETDRRNKSFVECLNRLIGAAGQREHCQEVETLLGGLGDTAESLLEQQDADGSADLPVTLRSTLLQALPLRTRGTPACRDCGICDLAERQVAEHLRPPAHCLRLDAKD